MYATIAEIRQAVQQAESQLDVSEWLFQMRHMLQSVRMIGEPVPSEILVGPDMVDALEDYADEHMPFWGETSTLKFQGIPIRSRSFP